MPSYYYTSDDEPYSTRSLFGRRKPLHDIFGGRKVADIVLWRNKQLSGGILGVVTLIWFLFEVVEYHFLTLLCHISIASMLLLFIWSNGAALFNKAPPKVPEMILSERAFKDVALIIHAKLNRFLSFLHDISGGKDLRLFLLTLVSLWMVSVIGSCCSSLSLLYFGILCIMTIPVLYEKYESDVDRIVYKGSYDLKRMYSTFDQKVLNKIPRGPVKEKKF
ncbi:reticulon-like protein B1 isoform X1 [Dioscorea cayenensis subsp. rotundata]|uniref:Reticulon-like protein n=1 Tax=Dioscorea cayennensis subsp. rotundata TaxID=55577 RepID=A0AB40CYV4_DIOCR|nr:reticulon-like protein B1 isoform X1 [Dioscorea cayenensis subsp. rotundata]